VIGRYLAFIRTHRHGIGFGALLMGLSSFGQTFFIALFGGHLKQAFDLSNGSLGTAYALGTFASAFTLQRVGRWIDWAGLRRYTIAVAALLASACALMAVNTTFAGLVLSFYLLRLGGQGLMVHTALTATARAFSRERGTALALANLGGAVGEGVLPLAVAGGMALIGWRAVWGVGAAIVLLGGCFAVWRLLDRGSSAAQTAATMPRQTRAAHGLWRDRRFLLMLPVALAPSFISTGFLFEQAQLLQEKQWVFTIWASWFATFALTRGAAMLLIGPVIDTVGAVRLLPLFALPLVLAMVSIAFVQAPWGMPLFLLPTGLSAGLSATLLTALLVELYGSARLAEVRSVMASASVIASGLAPIIMGFLIDAGVSLEQQAVVCLLYTVLASGLATRVRSGRHPAPPARP
jgi:MFS family permease